MRRTDDLLPQKWFSLHRQGGAVRWRWLNDAAQNDPPLSTRLYIPPLMPAASAAAGPDQAEEKRRRHLQGLHAQRTLSPDSSSTGVASIASRKQWRLGLRQAARRFQLVDRPILSRSGNREPVRHWRKESGRSMNLAIYHPAFNSYITAISQSEGHCSIMQKFTGISIRLRRITMARRPGKRREE